MKRREFLKASLATAGATLIPLQQRTYGRPKRPDSPNIVLIMADDFGHELLGCYGATSRKTPHIDRLAQTGMRFTRCYSSPKCVPSRLNIMTGRYGFRTGQEWGHFPPKEVSFGEVLQSAGYETALAGKWQLGVIKEAPDQIHKEGFDEYAAWGWHEGPRYWNPLIWRNGEILKGIKDKYGPEVFVDFLTDFISRHKDEPFFAYYPMVLPHSARTWGPEEFREPPGPEGKYQTKDEIVAKTDEMVGKIVMVLERLRLRDNTLVLFLGDNGSSRSMTTEHGDRRLRGGKGRFTDAGTHVPLIANWPGTVPGGTVCEDLIDFSDFLPTLADVAGARLPEGVTIDGRSFAPQIKGKQGNPREWVYVQMGKTAWIRTERWKLYKDGRLYDMKDDPMEQRALMPEEDVDTTRTIRKRLQASLDNLLES